MPRPRTLLRAQSRDAQRRFARPGRPLGPKSSNRATRRHNGHRHGDIAARVHGRHDRAWLFSGTINGGGQARINAKREARAEFWRTVRIRVSREMEPYFRDSLHLLGAGVRICGRTEHSPMDWFAVGFDVHIPGIPADAVTAVPTYRSVRVEGDRYEARLDGIEWHRADGSQIDTSALSPAI